MRYISAKPQVGRVAVAIATALATVIVCALFFVPAAVVAASKDKLVRHSLVTQDKGRVAIVNEDGKITWEYPCPNFTSHDIAVLPNGNILIHDGPAHVVEVTPGKQIVWQYQARPKAGYAGAVEIHAFQRLPDGLTMVSESGNARIVEVDRDGKIVHEVPLTVDHPNAHRDTRLARKLPNGNYLVAHEGDGMVREYDPAGKVVWSYTMDLHGQPRTPNHDGHGTEVFSAIRLPNGNTLIGGGNNNRVFEVSPKGETIWSVERDELAGIHLCWVTGVALLPNGHILFGNAHAGPDNPQVIEVTRDKKVVWMFKDWTNFGNDTVATQLLNVRGRVIR